MLISATGLYALWRLGRGQDWRSLVLASLTLMLVAGLNAIAFWTLRGKFEPLWWLPILYLLIYPLFFIPCLVR